MKRKPSVPLLTALAVFVFAGIGLSADVPEEEMYIVRDGKPNATIVVPEQADEWTRKAAEWISEYVKKSSGADLAIISEDERPDGTIISVGHTELAKKNEVDTAGLKWDGCRLVVRGSVLFLLGRDEIPVGEGWTGGAARGTCRAAVTFLEDFVGVRWFLPVPEGVLIPKKTNVFVPAGLEKEVSPPFAFIHGRYPYGVATPAAIANNYRTAIKLLSYGGHSYYEWLPAEKYFDEHPEYFAMIDGKRTGIGNHLCSSNPEVRNILLRGIREDFDAGYDWVALGQEDGYVPCECPECERLDKFRQVMGPSITSLEKGEEGWKDYLTRFRTAPCERLVSMHQWIIDECAKSHPDKKVHLLIYWPSLIPSVNLDSRRQNLVGEVAFYIDPLERDVMDLWKDKAHGLSVMVIWFDLTSSMGSMGVMMTPEEVAKRIQVYHQKGIIGLYGIHEANWGLQGPCYYVLGRMAGNPALECDSLVQEYCDGVYGSAGKTMKAFFDLLYTRSVNKLGYQWQVRSFGSTEDRHLLLYPLDFLRKLEPILQKAESEVKSEPESAQKMVALTRRYFDHLMLTTRMLISYRAYDANQSPENLEELKQMVANYEAFRFEMLTTEDNYEQPWPEQSDHDWLRKFLVGNGDDTNYYMSWQKRRDMIDLKDLGKIAVGFSGTVIREPITLDLLNKE